MVLSLMHPEAIACVTLVGETEEASNFIYVKLLQVFVFLHLDHWEKVNL